MTKRMKVQVVIHKRAIFILYSILGIIIVSSFSPIDAEANVNNSYENIKNVTESTVGSMIDNSSNIEIFDPETKLYGLTYDDHAKNYWKWLVSIPKNQTPEKDPTGARCLYGQENSNSSVFYLSSGPNNQTVERTCTVPYGKGILIPLMVVEVSDEEVPQTLKFTVDVEVSDEEVPKILKIKVDDLSKIIENLTRVANTDQNSVNNLYLRIDNTEYQMEDLSKYRIHTDGFVLNFPKDAVFGASEGPAIAVADGHYIVSKPLSKGEHMVHWKSSLKCPEDDESCFENSFTQDVKYKLIVK